MVGIRSRFSIPDSMLAGQHAAHLDAQPQDVGAESLGALQLTRLVGVVEDERMQVAVPGMKYIGDREPMGLRHFPHPPEYEWQPRARDRTIHAVVVRRDASDRRKSRLAAGPEQKPLRFRGRDPAGQRAALRGDRLDPRQQVIDLDLRAVELDDQQCLDIERIAGMDELLDGVDRRAVHHLHAARYDAGPDDPGHAVARMLGSREAHQHGARAFRFPQDPHRHLGDDAEQPFRPGHDPHEIIAAAVQMLAADANDLAGHQDDLETQHIVAGDTVFEAMHAAGIFRHIAADRTGDLGGRVGRIVEPGLLDRLRDGQIGHSGLRHHQPIFEVDLTDAA